MKLKGISIDAITPQNEPLNPNNNPSMVMQAADEAIFIKNLSWTCISVRGHYSKNYCLRSQLRQARLS